VAALKTKYDLEFKSDYDSALGSWKIDDDARKIAVTDYNKSVTAYNNQYKIEEAKFKKDQKKDIIDPKKLIETKACKQWTDYEKLIKKYRDAEKALVFGSGAIFDGTYDDVAVAGKTLTRLRTEASTESTMSNSKVNLAEWYSYVDYFKESDNTTPDGEYVTIVALQKALADAKTAMDDADASSDYAELVALIEPDVGNGKLLTDGGNACEKAKINVFAVTQDAEK
jgi:hypothetical protein